MHLSSSVIALHDRQLYYVNKHESLSPLCRSKHWQVLPSTAEKKHFPTHQITQLWFGLVWFDKYTFVICFKIKKMQTWAETSESSAWEQVETSGTITHMWNEKKPLIYSNFVTALICIPQLSLYNRKDKICKFPNIEHLEIAIWRLRLIQQYPLWPGKGNRKGQGQLEHLKALFFY